MQKQTFTNPYVLSVNSSLIEILADHFSGVAEFVEDLVRQRQKNPKTVIRRELFIDKQGKRLVLQCTNLVCSTRGAVRGRESEPAWANPP